MEEDVIDFELAKKLNKCGFAQSKSGLVYITVELNCKMRFDDRPCVCSLSPGDRVYLKDFYDGDCRDSDTVGSSSYVAAPTYIEVWEWLWTKKDIKLEIAENSTLAECAYCEPGTDKVIVSEYAASPLEAIKSAIKQLFDKADSGIYNSLCERLKCQN